MNMRTMIALLIKIITMTYRVKIIRPKKQLLDCVSSSLDQLVQGVRCAANLANNLRMMMDDGVQHEHEDGNVRDEDDDGHDGDVQQD